MKETILLFGFSGERQKKVMRALLPLKLRIRRVEGKELASPLEELVSPLPDHGKPETVQNPEAEPEGAQNPEAAVWAPGDEMLVMAGLTSARVDAVLMALRKGKTGPVPYKAVLTEANRRWDAFRLLAELKEEHARFTAQTP